MNLAIVICVIAVNCIIFFLYEKQQRKSPDSLLLESNGIFKHDKAGGITCILCGILLIGLFILIAFKDSEATLYLGVINPKAENRETPPKAR